MATKTQTIEVKVDERLAARGVVTGVLIGGCSVFGPGIGASVY